MVKCLRFAYLLSLAAAQCCAAVFIKGSVSCFSGNRPCVCILHSFYTNCCILQQHLVSGWASIERNISIFILFLKNKDLITAKHIKNNFNQVLLHWQVLSGSLCRVVCHREELCWRTSELTSDTQLCHSSEISQCSEEAGYERHRSTPPSQTLDLWTSVLDLKIIIESKYLPNVFIIPFGSLG